MDIADQKIYILIMDEIIVVFTKIFDRFMIKIQLI